LAEVSIPHALLISQKGKYGGTYSEALQLLPSTRAWPAILHMSNDAAMGQGNETYYNGMIADYPANVKSCTLRFGAAFGAWKTEGIVPMPAAIKRHAVGRSVMRILNVTFVKNRAIRRGV